MPSPAERAPINAGGSQPSGGLGIDAASTPRAPAIIWTPSRIITDAKVATATDAGISGTSASPIKPPPRMPGIQARTMLPSMVPALPCAMAAAMAESRMAA